MRSILLSLAVLGLVACSKKAGDDCQRFVDKSKPILEKMMKEAGKSVSDKDLAAFVDKCRKEPERKKDPIMACVLDAKDDAAVAACYGSALGDYAKASKGTEGPLQLNKLGKNAKVAYATNAQFPVGKAGPTPATSCCAGPGGKCPITADWAASPIWSALDFQLDEPNLFQYMYESDGKTGTATAIGDLDCDGTMITYKLELSAADGNATMNIVAPPPNSD